MNNGLILRPRFARTSFRGASFRSFAPKRLERLERDTESLGQPYTFVLSSNTATLRGYGGLVSQVLASSEESSLAYSPWKAFDGSNAMGAHWLAAPTSVSSWLRVDFFATQVVRRYDISASFDMPQLAPKSWTFEASNDGTNWDILDTRTSVANWTSAELRSYKFSNAKAYLSYRINVTLVENTGSGTGYTSIGELYLYN